MVAALNLRVNRRLAFPPVADSRAVEAAAGGLVRRHPRLRIEATWITVQAMPPDYSGPQSFGVARLRLSTPPREGAAAATSMFQHFLRRQSRHRALSCPDWNA